MSSQNQQKRGVTTLSQAKTGLITAGSGVKDAVAAADNCFSAAPSIQSAVFADFSTDFFTVTTVTTVTTENRKKLKSKASKVFGCFCRGLKSLKMAKAVTRLLQTVTSCHTAVTNCCHKLKQLNYK